MRLNIYANGKKLELSINNKSNKKWILAIIIFSFSLYSLIKKDLTKQNTSTVDQVFIGVVAPLQESINNGQNFFSELWNIYISNVGAVQRRTAMTKEFKKLKNEIFTLSEIKLENERLRKVLNYFDTHGYKGIVAEVSSRDAGSLFKTIRINKGGRDGIKVESPVYTPKGLVGFVYQVYKNHSEVITILDSISRVEVLVDKTRSHGILEGISSDVCLIKYVDQDENIVLGDIALTSGLGNIYPKGIEVGRVIKIEKESFGITQELILKPSVNFNKLEEVIIGVKNAR